MPFVTEVIPSYQGDVTIESQGKSENTAVLSIDPQKLLVISPTLELTEGSVVRPNNPSSILIAEDTAYPPGEETPFIYLGPLPEWAEDSFSPD